MWRSGDADTVPVKRQIKSGIKTSLSPLVARCYAASSPGSAPSEAARTRARHPFPAKHLAEEANHDCANTHQIDSSCQHAPSRTRDLSRLADSSILRPLRPQERPGQSAIQTDPRVDIPLQSAVRDVPKPTLQEALGGPSRSGRTWDYGNDPRRDPCPHRIGGKHGDQETSRLRAENPSSAGTWLISSAASSPTA